MYRMCLDHLSVPHSSLQLRESTPIISPSQFHILLLFLLIHLSNPLSPINAAHMCLSHPLGHGGQWPYPQRKVTLAPPAANSSSVSGAASGAPPTSILDFVTLLPLHR